MTQLFSFGETHPDYTVRVINEREARAGAGLLLFPAMVAFMNSWLIGNYQLTQLMVTGFFADFAIRVLVNPRFSPSLVLGRWLVRNQVPEYVGAPQKRFAWLIGLLLASVMLYLVVFHNVRGPVTMLICSLCLLLLFFESAFGICIGCKLYNVFHAETAKLCPGGVCEVKDRQPIQHISVSQYVALLGFVLALAWVNQAHHETTPPVPRVPASQADAPANDAAEEERCRVPEFAKKIGHEEKWKLHNGCK